MIERIDLRFRSGNSLPVERAHIMAKEWELIKEVISASNSVVAAHHDGGHYYELAEILSMRLHSLREDSGNG